MIKVNLLFYLLAFNLFLFFRAYFKHVQMSSDVVQYMDFVKCVNMDVYLLCLFPKHCLGYMTFIGII